MTVYEWLKSLKKYSDSWKYVVLEIKHPLHGTCTIEFAPSYFEGYENESLTVFGKVTLYIDMFSQTKRRIIPLSSLKTVLNCEIIKLVHSDSKVYKYEARKKSKFLI